METIAAHKLNPWFSIWTRPRATMRSILEAGPGRIALPLALIGGFSQVLCNAAFRSVGDRLSIPQILFASAVVGIAAGLLLFYGMSGLLLWTGKRLSGRAQYAHVKAVVGWSNIPAVWSLALFPPELLLFGQELFTSATPSLDSSLALSVTFLLFVLIKFILLIWGVVIFIKCLAEAQRFSVWKSLANAAMAALILAAPVLILAII